MSQPTKPRDTVRKNAQNYFARAEQRDKLVRQEIEKERAASAAKTAKLRALRLAKEAADKEEADKVAAERTAAKVKADAERTPRRSRGVAI